MAKTNPVLDQWLEPFYLDFPKLCTLTSELAATYKHLALQSVDQFLPTPVTKLPTGQEQGDFLSIDLGGSNLRVSFVTLLGEASGFADLSNSNPSTLKITKSHERSWTIEEYLKNGNLENLFSWLGDCLAEVIQSRFNATSFNGETIPDEIPLGITFSFPMIQTSLSEARLMPMGKGFSISSDLSLGSMILAGYSKHTSNLPKVSIVAIANDAVATLISSAYSTGSSLKRTTVVGLIAGTGCNAAVVVTHDFLAPSKVLSMKDRDEVVQQMVVNTEWSLSGAAKPLHELGLFTLWDTALDSALPKSGFQPFEYMTAGLYIGEIVRRLLVDYFEEVLLFSSSDYPKILNEEFGLTTAFLGRNVATANDATALAVNLNKLLVLDPTLVQDPGKWTVSSADVLLRAERAVVRRSAAMLGAAIVALLIATSHLNGLDTGPHASKELIVAYCGGFICGHWGYKEQVQQVVDDLVEYFKNKGDQTRVILEENSDGGVLGAGVLAGSARRFGQ